MFDLKSRVTARSSKATTAKYQPFRVTIRVLTCTFYYQEAVRADSCKLSHQCILWSWECGCVRGKLSISYRGGVDDFECQNSKPGPFQIQLCLTLQGQSTQIKKKYVQNTALLFSLPLMVSIIVPGFLQLYNWYWPSLHYYYYYVIIITLFKKKIMNNT